MAMHRSMVTAAIIAFFTLFAAPWATQAAVADQISAEAEAARVDMIKRVKDRVVTVNVVTRQDPIDCEPFCEIFKQPLGNGKHGQAVGSGLIYRGADGLIATPLHVIEQAAEIQVRFADGSSAPATVLGMDDLLGIALLRAAPVQGVDLPWSASTPEVGSSVLIVGQAYALGVVATEGIVSGVVATENGRPPVIFTDAQLHKAMSGAPLLNRRGEIVGIGFAIYGTSETVLSRAAFGVAADASLVRPALERLLSLSDGKD